MYGGTMMGILGEGFRGWNCQERGNGKAYQEVYGCGERGHGSD